MALGIKPLNDRLIVGREQKEEMTAGGIVLPESAKEKPIKGKVMAVGQGRRLDNGKSFHCKSKKVKPSCSANTLELKLNWMAMNMSCCVKTM
jgi:hypothetical protein